METQNQALSILSYLLVLGGMAYGTITYRNKALDGFISYGHALKSCVLIVLVIAIVTALFIYIYVSIDNSFIEKALDKAEEEMATKDMPEEQMEMGLEYARKFMQPHWMAIMSFIAYMFFGFILALIVAAVVKKDNPNPFINTIDSSVN